MKNELKNRKVELKPLKKFQRILCVLDEQNSFIINWLTAIFTEAEINVLFQRKSKEDNSSPSEYTVHSSDFNLTGNLKNDKLKGMLTTSFDLVIDLHQNSKFVNKILIQIKSTLVIGRIGQENEKRHDLYFDFDSDLKNFTNTIATQITVLTQNEHSKI